MASDSEGEDYVYYGTPLEQESASTVYARPAGAQDAAKTVALPAHQQQVRDDQGRQRLHGAFTGGFSAGYYNSEGWSPATFRSSRGSRVATTKQSVDDFLDEDERAERTATTLKAGASYDTFAGRAEGEAQRAAAAEAARRHGAAGGGLTLLPRDALQPAQLGIGMRLLQKMGWRPGTGIGTHEAEAFERMGLPVDAAAADALAGAQPPRKRRKWEAPATNAAGQPRRQNPPLYLMEPKDDVFGVGYDPYKNAEEFRHARQKQRAGASGAREAPGVRQRGLAFAPSVLEAADAWQGELADYADEDEEDARTGYNNEIVSSDNDSDEARGARGRLRRLEAASGPAGLLKARQGTMGNDSWIEGFVKGPVGPEGDLSGVFGAAPAADERDAGRRPPRPKQHVFEQDCAQWYGAPRSDAQAPAAPAVEAPSDAALKERIDKVAALVARGGAPALELAKETHQGDADFDFLDGGLGAGFFHFRVSSIRTALARAGAVLHHTPPAAVSGPSLEQRAALLGEQPLPGTAKAPAHSQPAPAADKERAQGGQEQGWVERAQQAGILRPGTGLASRFVSSEAAPSTTADTRAQATASDAAGTGSAGAAESDAPVRAQREWAPESLLCKRFNVPNPAANKHESSVAGAGGPDYLSAAPEQRQEIYASSLPSHMRPAGTAGAASSARGASAPQQDQQQLPGPPLLKPGKPFGDTEAFIDQLLASVEDQPAAAPTGTAATTAPGASGSNVATGKNAAAASIEVPVEKPMDIYKAIFEDSDYGAAESSSSSSDGDAGGHDAPASSGAAAGAEAQAQGHGAPAHLEPVTRAAAESSRDPHGGASAAQGARMAFQRRLRSRSASPPVNGATNTHDAVAAGGARAASSDSNGSGQSAGRAATQKRSMSVSPGRQHRKGKSKHKKRSKDREKKKAQKDEELLQRALDTVRHSARESELSTAEIVEMAKALKKRSRHRGSGSDSSGDDRPRNKHRKKTKHKSKERKKGSKRDRGDT